MTNKKLQFALSIGAKINELTLDERDLL